MPFIKPSPNGIDLIIEQQIHCTRTYTYIIGDAVHDLESEHLSAISTIAVSWGFTTKKELMKFDCGNKPLIILKFVEQSMEKTCISYMNKQ